MEASPFSQSITVVIFEAEEVDLSSRNLTASTFVFWSFPKNQAKCKWR
jgi:hypothetical protein